MFGGGVLEICEVASGEFPPFGAKQCRLGLHNIAGRVLLQEVKDILRNSSKRGKPLLKSNNHSTNGGKQQALVRHPPYAAGLC